MILPMKPILLLLAAASIALAADNTLTPAEKQAGFQLLFDGHSFNGWRNPASEKPPGEAWVIEDGCLKTTPNPRITEDLVSSRSYGNFELAFDWRISPKGNTGVKYRIQRTVLLDNSHPDPKVPFEITVERALTAPKYTRATLPPGDKGQEYTISYEFQLIDPSAGAADGGVHQVGALYSMIPPRKQAAHPPLEWNTGRLVVKGDHFEHWINGVMVLDGELHSRAGLDTAAKRWGTRAPHVQEIFEHAEPTGPVSLQHHGAAVWFKNLKIRPL